VLSSDVPTGVRKSATRDIHERYADLAKRPISWRGETNFALAFSPTESVAASQHEIPSHKVRYSHLRANTLEHANNESGDCDRLNAAARFPRDEMGLAL
jgi:hypothetical protein